jgi:hypothetical protein
MAGFNKLPLDLTGELKKQAHSRSMSAVAFPFSLYAVALAER